jgi:hypothetical protein
MISKPLCLIVNGDKINFYITNRVFCHQVFHKRPVRLTRFTGSVQPFPLDPSLVLILYFYQRP